MKRYVLKRLIQSIVVMFIMSICSFALINAAPGEPAAAIYGGQMDKLTQAEKDRINENLGLNQPVIIRYGNWLAEVSHGNFGYSYANGQNVGKMIKERMPNTMTLFLSSCIDSNPGYCSRAFCRFTSGFYDRQSDHDHQHYA